CAEKGAKGLPTGEDWRDWTAEDLEDLVQETVAAAARKFQSNGREGRGWQPHGGASLTSYFITGCLFAFVSTYKRHRRDRDRDRTVTQADTRSPARPDQESDIADRIAGNIDAAESLARLIPDPRLRLVMDLYSQEYSTAEISEVLADDTTPKAVEGMIY